MCHQSGLLGGETEWGGGGEGAKSYVGDKAPWSSINHSILGSLVRCLERGGQPGDTVHGTYARTYRYVNTIVTTHTS